MGLGVKIKNVTKTYGPIAAVDNVSLNIVSGELFGIIGPDGAGKSSLLRMIATLILPDNGKIDVGQYDAVADYHAIRGILGYMPGRFSLYQDLTVEENLEFFASVFGSTVSKNYHIIKDIYQALEPFKNRLAGKLSGGMKQKLALCCSLIHEPQVLLLDEPTTGVDPVSRFEFWEILKRLSSGGMTIIVSTPYMDEAYKCDRIAMMLDGRILEVGTPDEIISDFRDTLWKITGENVYDLLLAVRHYPCVKMSNSFGDSLHIVIDDDIDNLKSHLYQKGFNNVMIEKVLPSIEDCFIKFVDENGRK